MGERRAGLPPPGRGAKRRQVHPDLTRDTAEAEAAMEEWVRGSGVCGLLGVASDAGLHDIALAVARADEASGGRLGGSERHAVCGPRILTAGGDLGRRPCGLEWS